uniref:tetratricopeptide repeat protein n=1 Tax=Zhouia sp. PK063 TaxID=3373602 RepID=UPI0037DC0BA3
MDSYKEYVTKINFIKYSNDSTAFRKDSLRWLEQHLPDIKNDSAYWEIHSKMTYLYYVLDDTTGYRRSNKQDLLHGIAIKDTSRIARYYWRRGNLSNYIKRDYDSAYYYYQQARKLYQILEDDMSVANLTINLAIIQKDYKDYITSENLTFEVIKTATRLKNYSTLNSSFNNLGIIYNNLKEYDKALEYYSIAISYAIKNNDVLAEITDYNNVGMTYKELGKYDKAIEQFNKALNRYDVLQYDKDIYTKVIANRAETKILMGNLKGVENELK